MPLKAALQTNHNSKNMDTLERSQKENTDKKAISTSGSLAVIDALLSEKIVIPNENKFGVSRVA